jgi:hypothetical protein
VSSGVFGEQIIPSSLFGSSRIPCQIKPYILVGKSLTSVPFSEKPLMKRTNLNILIYEFCSVLILAR